MSFINDRNYWPTIHSLIVDKWKIQHRKDASASYSTVLLQCRLTPKQQLTLNSSMMAVRTLRQVSTPSSSRGKCSGKSIKENRVWSGNANNNGGCTSLGSTWICKQNRNNTYYMKRIICGRFNVRNSQTHKLSLIVSRFRRQSMDKVRLIKEYCRAVLCSKKTR